MESFVKIIVQKPVFEYDHNIYFLKTMLLLEPFNDVSEKKKW